MMCSAGARSVQYRSQPRKYVLDYADYTAPYRLRDVWIMQLIHARDLYLPWMTYV